jgi:hypothetical protein
MSSRKPFDSVSTTLNRASNAAATASMDVPHSVSCGWALSSDLQAASSRARVAPSPPAADSAIHGSTSCTSIRSARALRRFCAARVPKVPWSVHVYP